MAESCPEARAEDFCPDRRRDDRRCGAAIRRQLGGGAFGVAALGDPFDPDEHWRLA